MSTASEDFKTFASGVSIMPVFSAEVMLLNLKIGRSGGGERNVKFWNFSKHRSNLKENVLGAQTNNHPPPTHTHLFQEKVKNPEETRDWRTVPLIQVTIQNWGCSDWVTLMEQRRTRGCLQESSVSTLLGSARAKVAWKSDEDKNSPKGKCSLQGQKQRAVTKRRWTNCVQRKEWSCSGLLVGSFRSQTCSPVCIRKVPLLWTPGALSWVLQLFSDTHDGW